MRRYDAPKFRQQFLPISPIHTLFLYFVNFKHVFKSLPSFSLSILFMRIINFIDKSILSRGYEFLQVTFQTLLIY